MSAESGIQKKKKRKEDVCDLILLKGSLWLGLFEIQKLKFFFFFTFAKK